MHCDASINKKEKKQQQQQQQQQTFDRLLHRSADEFISHMNLFKQKMAQTEIKKLQFSLFLYQRGNVGISFRLAPEESKCYILHPSSVTVHSLYTAFPSMPLLGHTQGHTRLHQPQR
ncbi:hypothetical protein PAMP_024081 [Pampus punctatissimus]